MKLTRRTNGIELIISHEKIGKDLLISIHGGDEHHIGGAALAYPTQSHYRDAITVSVNTITAPGHKDYLVANSVAETVCKVLHVPVLVSVGIHVDNATKEQINDILSTVDEMVKELIEFYQKPE